MKARKADLARAVDSPDPKLRLYLFYGPDESQSRALGERLVAGLKAEKAPVSPQMAKSDPAILADEAGSIGLFGGRRAVWVEPAGDDIVPAVAALLEAPALESPVIAVGGALRKSSALVKLAEAHAMALAHASYEPDAGEAERMVEEMARGEGLRLQPGIAGRIAASAGLDRAIIAQELAKLALYLGASPARPAEAGHDSLDSIGAGQEGDWTRLADLALGGETAALAAELEHVQASAEPISVLRALQRRLVMLAPIRARVESGQRPHDAVTSAAKSVFFKEKDKVARLAALWSAPALARLIERSGELERRLMRPDSPPPFEALEEELVAIARSAGRR